jgi:sigma-B regulation protein RsbU (phosphoserine phosphatase)
MHLILEDTTNPKEVFAKLNKMVRKTQNRKMFVTAIFAVIDSEKNICTLFNAGHLPPYKISGESGELFKIRRHGITLGAIDNINDDASDSEVVFDFNKGDKIFLYTDGVVEAMDNKRGEYGFARLESFLNENACKPPKELLDGIQKDVNAFTGGAELADDISILIIAKN